MIGSKIKRLRLERGLSMARLGKEMGTTAAKSVWEWETGRRRPSDISIAKLERVFGEKLKG